MKIVKKSMFSDIFPMKVKCERVVDEYHFSYGTEIDFCGSELEVDIDDIKKHSWEKYPDFKGTDYGVKCPVCGKFIAINKDKLPSYVIEHAEEIRLN